MGLQKLIQEEIMVKLCEYSNPCNLGPSPHPLNPNSSSWVQGRVGRALVGFMQPLRVTAGLRISIKAEKSHFQL